MWLESEKMHFFVFVSHILTVPSFEEDANRLQFGFLVERHQHLNMKKRKEKIIKERGERKKIITHEKVPKKLKLLVLCVLSVRHLLPFLYTDSTV